MYMNMWVPENLYIKKFFFSFSSGISSKCNLSTQVRMDKFNPENAGATGTSEF